MHRFAVALATLILAASSAASGQQGRQYQVQSPDGATQLTVEVGPQLSYSVTHRGRPLLSSSPISLTLQGGRVLGAGDRVRSEARRQVRDSVLPLAPTKSGVVRDRYNELRLRFGSRLDGRTFRRRASQAAVPLLRSRRDRADAVAVARASTPAPSGSG